VEQTVTLHRLGLAGTLGVSLRTTNGLESIFAQVERRTAKVDHWRTSAQKQRCMAAALLDIEPPALPDQGASPPARAPAGPCSRGEGHAFSTRSAGRCVTNPGKCFAISTKNGLDPMERRFPRHRSPRP
jgi:hypothetical protein